MSYLFRDVPLRARRLVRMRFQDEHTFANAYFEKRGCFELRAYKDDSEKM